MTVRIVRGNFLPSTRFDALTVDLPSTDLSGLTAAITTGYYTAGDGGGATWRATGNTGTPGTTDFPNGKLYDVNGLEFIYDAFIIAPNLRALGAVGDNVADDRPALVAADGAGAPIMIVPDGTFRMSSIFATVTPILSFGGVFTVDSGTWAPRQFINLGADGYRGEKTVYSADFTGDASTYTFIEEAQAIRLEGLNFAGKSQATGATSRTQASQVYLTQQHFAEGDCYNLSLNGGVTAHGNGTVDEWGKQNSGGMGNGQWNAITSKVNLYGIGDIVLNADAKTDVAMLGIVVFLDHDSPDSGDYAPGKVPRLAQMLSNLGALDIDVHLTIRGKSYVGIDLSGGTYASNAAIALKLGQTIAWDAIAGTGSGVFATEDVGTTNTKFDGTTLTDTVDGNPVLQRTDEEVVVQGVDSGTTLNVKGATASAWLTLGQSALDAFITAHSSGTDNTTLALRTSNAGTETIRLLIAAGGTVKPGADSTQSLGAIGARWLDAFATSLRPGAGAVVWTSGSGTPEGSLAAPVGSLYTDTASATSLYVKQTGAGGNTGWVAK